MNLQYLQKEIERCDTKINRLQDEVNFLKLENLQILIALKKIQLREKQEMTFAQKLKLLLK